ncbi:hypothetical protein EMMF5_002509 [Cystobasidiomycetes sp. EMM_F5]
MRSLWRLQPGLTLLAFAWQCHATNLTASVDYGFGPLWINLNETGNALSRCDIVHFQFGGGLAPYTLAAVNAGNKSTDIKLDDKTSASWQVAVAKGSHVAFNMTDRAGANLQTTFFDVQGSDADSCANSTEYTATPTGQTSKARQTEIASTAVVGLAVLLAIALLVVL